jgi:prepilin-type N-terminal cleavage/methylation domain-containing protein
MKVFAIKRAFSLIELSVVLIIVSILMVAIVKGSDLIAQSRIAAAAKKTAQSPVLKIDGLAIWFETTLKNSIADRQKKDGGKVNNWYDNSGRNPNAILSAAQNTSANQPNYVADAFNGLPALQFDGVDDYLNFDGSAITNGNYSVFVVEQRSNDNNNGFIGSTSSAGLFLRYIGSDKIQHKLGSDGGEFNSDVADFNNPKPQISAFIHNHLANPQKSSFINGVAAATLADAATISEYSGGLIGAHDENNTFDGLIAEVIMFSKALTDQERKDVERYLLDKYDIGG